MFDEYAELTDFKVGDRVAIHPRFDLYMQGFRFGNVTRIGYKYVMVQLDGRQTQRAFLPADVAPIYGG